MRSAGYRLTRRVLVVFLFLGAGEILAAEGPSLAAGAGSRANPVTKQVARENVFEFAQKPKVSKRGDKWVITFASRGRCDATVAIADKDGKIVRHLASGVLGANAPWPFKQGSLSQSIEWDGKDDRGKPAPAGCKVRVGLGIGATYEMSVGWDPYNPNGSPSHLAVGPDGTLYVASTQIRAYDREGRYLRTLVAPPAHVLRKQLEKSGGVKTAYGDTAPFRRDQRRAVPWDTSVSGGVGLVSADGKVVLFAGWGNHNWNASGAVWRYGADGTALGPVGISGAKDRRNGSAVTIYKTAHTPEDHIFTAYSPDREWVYLSGTNHAVFRKRAAGYVAGTGGAPALFAGERNKSGNDNKHFNGAGGVAVDKDGNVYVADRLNNRIQVLKPDGSLLKSLPAKAPYALQVHPKTGAIYYTTLGRPSGRGRKKATLVKLAGKGSPAQVAAFEYECFHNQGASSKLWGFAALDAGAKEPVLWLAGPNKVWRVVDRGAAFEEAGSIAPRGAGLGTRPNLHRMAVDRAREEVYIRRGGWRRFDGKTGEVDKAWKIPERRLGEGVAVGPDGHLYWMGLAAPFVARYTREGKQVPFASPEPPTHLKPISAYRGGPIPGAIYHARHHNSNVWMGGIAVAPNGDIYTASHEHSTGWLNEKFAGVKWHQRQGVYLIHVYDKDGKYKGMAVDTRAASQESARVFGVRIGRDGGLYVGAALRRVGVEAPHGIVPGQKFAWSGYGGVPGLGALIKYSGRGGKLPLGRFSAGKSGQGAAFRHSHGVHHIEGVAWSFDGLSQMPPFACGCGHARFDLDGFDRAFVPAMQLASIVALDANGNEILRIGRYGNADSRGKDSPVADPKTGLLRPRRPDDPKDLASPLADPDIGINWVQAIAVSDTALYFSDSANDRVVKAALGYHVEEVVPVR